MSNIVEILAVKYLVYSTGPTYSFAVVLAAMNILYNLLISRYNLILDIILYLILDKMRTGLPEFDSAQKCIVFWKTKINLVD